MRKTYLLFLILIFAFSTSAHEFTYKYNGQTLNYRVISEDDNTVEVVSSYDADYVEPSGDVVIPSQVKDGTKVYTVVSLGTRVFYANNSITSVTIPPSVQNVGNEVLSNCTRLKKIIIMDSPEVLTTNNYIISTPIDYLYLGRNLGETNRPFFRCSIKEIEVGGYVTTWCNGFFYGNQTIQKLVISSQMTQLADQSFQECSNLMEVSLPETLAKIGSQVFYKCPSIKVVKMDAPMPPEFSRADYNFDTDVIKSARLIVPEGCEDAYKSANVWDEFKEIIGYTKILVDNIYFKNAFYSVNPGQTLDLNDDIVILPADAEDKGLNWESSDESVATVNEGVVKVLAEGKCNITASTKDGSNLSASCKLSSANYEIKEGKERFHAEVSRIFQALGCAPEFWQENLDITITVTAQGNLIINPASLYMCGSYIDTSIELRKSGNKYTLSLPITLKKNYELTLLKLNPTTNQYNKISGSHTATFTVSPGGVITLVSPGEDVILGEYMTDIKYFSGTGLKELVLTPLNAGLPEVVDEFEGAPVEVYNLQGIKMSDNIDSLAPGFYIIRQGYHIEKIVVK